jgi:hypothetical protein
MEDLLKNKLFWAVALLAVFNLGFYVVGKALVDKTADRVIEKLQKEYSPSPYGPGLDPDRVDPDGLRGLPEGVYELTKTENGDIINYVPLSKVQDASVWREGWERDRGANPEQ